MRSSPITSLPSSFTSGQGNSPGRLGSLTAYAISASLALIRASRVVRSRSTRSDAAFSEPRSTRVAASASTEMTKISASPRCGLSPGNVRTAGLPRPAADLDLAVADAVAHLAVAAVERFAGLQLDSGAAFADRDAHSRLAAAGRRARVGRPFAADPDRQRAPPARHRDCPP